MDLLLFIVFGAVAGWLASIVMSTNHQQGILADIILGVVGSLVGGMIMGMFGQSGVSGFNLYSLLVAVLGASVVIYIGRMLRYR